MAIDLNRSASMPTDEVVELSGNEKHNEKHSQSKGDMVSVSLDDDVNAEVAHDLESRFELGSKFDSLDQVYLIYCEYARVLGFSVRKGSQRYFDKITEETGYQKIEGKEQVFPRILRWSAPDYFQCDDLMRFLQAEPLEHRGLLPPTKVEWSHLQRLGLQQRHLSPLRLLQEVIGMASPPKFKDPTLVTESQMKRQKLSNAPRRRTRRNAVDPPLDSTAESKSHPRKNSDHAAFGREDIGTNVPLDEIIAANVKELLERVGSIEKIMRSCRCMRNSDQDIGMNRGQGHYNREESRVPHQQAANVRLETIIDLGKPSLGKATCRGQVKTAATTARQLFTRNPSWYDPLHSSYIAGDAKPFQVWYEKAKKRGIKCETPLPFKSRSSVNWDWFTPLETREGWLCSEQIDVLTNLLLFKYNISPEKFATGWTVLEQLGTGLLMNGDPNDVSTTLLDYVMGRLPIQGGLPWAQARKVIGIANVYANHWICYCISLDEARIVVYDSTSKSSDWDRMAQQFGIMCRLLPLVCRLGKVWEGSERKEPEKDIWSVEQFRHPPQQGNCHDSGVMAIIFMECLVFDFQISQLTPDRCGIFRRSYCAELFELGIKHAAS